MNMACEPYTAKALLVDWRIPVEQYIKSGWKGLSEGGGRVMAKDGSSEVQDVLITSLEESI